MSESKVVVVTGASSGFGAMTVRALADAGHTVYAGIRDTAGRNAGVVADTTDYARSSSVDLRPLEMDVSDQSSVDAAVARIIAEAGRPSDTATEQAYEERYAGLMDQVGAKLAELSPPDADPTQVAARIVDVVDTPKGRRPFRVHIDPADDGAEVVNAVGDRIRREFYARIDLGDLLHPAV